MLTEYDDSRFDSRDCSPRSWTRASSKVISLTGYSARVCADMTDESDEMTELPSMEGGRRRGLAETSDMVVSSSSDICRW